MNKTNNISNELTDARPAFIDFGAFKDTSRFETQMDLGCASVVECAEEYKNSMGGEKGARRGCRSLISKLEEIQRENGVVFFPNMINMQFYILFEQYLVGAGLSPNTIAGMIQGLNAVLRWAAMYGAKLSKEFNSHRPKGGDSRPLLALTDDELSQINWFNIDQLNVRSMKKETLKKVRDQFVLSCYLGQRYSDVRRLSHKNFGGARKNMFSMVQQKTGNKAIFDFNSIHRYCPNFVYDILERYDYSAPYPYDISDYNKHLHFLFRHIPGFDKEIAHDVKVGGQIVRKTFKKYQLISSHTARRTFITLAVKHGIMTQDIKAASGHKSDSAFNRYVKLDDYR